jgi:hypothetical protein
MISKYNAAKKVADFYVNKLRNNIEDPRAVFAIQTAQLKTLKRQNQAILNALNSYDIEYQ